MSSGYQGNLELKGTRALLALDSLESQVSQATPVPKGPQESRGHKEIQAHQE